jgi:hypothetical protein
MPAVQAAAEVKDDESSLYSAQEGRITQFGFSRGFGTRYELQEKIGSGTFGIVHAAVNKSTGERWVWPALSMPAACWACALPACSAQPRSGGPTAAVSSGPNSSAPCHIWTLA